MWFLILFLNLPWAHGESSQISTPFWARQGFSEDRHNYYYVGFSSGARTKSLAIDLAEKKALEELIKDAFGVQVQLNSEASETLTTSELNITKSERSDNIRLKGFRKSQMHVESEPDGYAAWVQVSVPKLEVIAEAQRQRAKAIKPKNEVETYKPLPPKLPPQEIQEVAPPIPPPAPVVRSPKLYRGQSKRQFFSQFPKPSRVSASYSFEFYYYDKSALCESSYPCKVVFYNGQIDSWERIAVDYIDLTK